ncbi:MAG: ATP-binding protein [bacterium]
MSRISSWGLLVVAGLLAVGLAVLGLSIRRSMDETAEQALEGRALELGLSVAAALLMVRPQGPDRLQKTVSLLLDDAVRSVAVVTLNGRVIASTEPKEVGRRIRSRALRRLRSQETVHVVERIPGSAGPTFEVWIMLRPGLRGRHWRAYKRWSRRVREHGGPPPEGSDGPSSAEPDGPSSRGPEGLRRRNPDDRPLRPHSRRGSRLPGILGTWKGRPPWGRAFLRLRVQVTDKPITSAVDRARWIQVVTLSSAGLLLLLALLLFVADRKARRLRGIMERQRALAEMGEMAAVLAHEIRTPLGVIKGHAQLLEEKAEPAARDKLSVLVSQSGRLERLVNALLDYARPAPPVLKDAAADALVEQACELVAGEAVKREVALIRDLEQGTVRVDPDQILQVLLNLLRNGLQASPQGSAITIRLRFRSGRMVIEVVDAGEGLPADAPADIFQPFVTTRQEGTGLGLAISRRIAEAHGGSLTARNAPDRGARFVLTLPQRGLRRGGL